MSNARAWCETAAVKNQQKYFLWPRSVRIGKNCALGLEHGPRPAASGRTQEVGHIFSQYGPPGRQITYISYMSMSNPLSGCFNLTGCFTGTDDSQWGDHALQ